MVQIKQKIKLWSKIVFDFVITIVLPLVIWFEFGYKYGLPALIIAVILVLLLRGWKSRKLFIFQLQEIERVMWGKSLDKENWEKGEISNVKLKPQWRKKDDR